MVNDYDIMPKDRG